MHYVTLKTTCGKGADTKIIDVKYLIIDTVSHYNIILGSPTIKTLEAIMSTRYLTLKYPLLDGRVGTIRGDQQILCENYLSSLETAR